MEKEALKYLIALGLLPGIGPVRARNIIAHFGSVEAVFEHQNELRAIIPKLRKENPGIFTEVLERAEEEFLWAEKKGVQIFSYLDQDYSYRLKNAHDHPLILYYKGTASLNKRRIIGIVGTRKASEYGKKALAQIMEVIAPYHPLIVSGLAYGIDIEAHQKALDLGLETIAVLGHGLHTVYPSLHRKTAQKMERQGGLLTEFLSGSKFEKENFPKRNRIVAGMIDALIVIETKRKGGSMITAELAFNYNREVFAVPGNFDQENSQGCNYLIRKLKAQMLDKPEAFPSQISWPAINTETKNQQELPLDLRPEEQNILQVLSKQNEIAIDDLSQKTGLKHSALAEILLELEFKGLVSQKPGKRFKRS